MKVGVVGVVGALAGRMEPCAGESRGDGVDEVLCFLFFVLGCGNGVLGGFGRAHRAVRRGEPG